MKDGYFSRLRVIGLIRTGNDIEKYGEVKGNRLKNSIHRPLRSRR